ncbi:AbiJ-NTD4 domain-containing protein [Shimia abyssi]|uniref:HEPN AbiJ-N-terminal domain-containing protein n=1 Tax=Shimia abyssi TaxID=1662395 RepID=A0A2P8F6G2_9RHOB|nr:hypothetical protein [Shimia abyssi]PSL17307.1 hypothetical protein CLV88_11980 [Shimia abyssi]
MSYFSEREHGERPRSSEIIGEGAWGGIQALIIGRIEDGSFGATYPETCQDGAGPFGTDANLLARAVRAEIPAFADPPWFDNASEPPETLDILDLIEFCWRAVGQPIKGSYHGYFQHYHLSHDTDVGRDEFREAVNRILRRNGLTYKLLQNGQMERLAPPVLRELLTAATFRTGDNELDAMLEKARKRFFDPDISVRRESLEALWDAWERLKTLNGPDKKTQFPVMLNNVSGPNSPVFREALENEARELTRLGNKLQIRHAETDREPVSESSHVDYLFHRLFAFVAAVLKAEGRGWSN